MVRYIFISEEQNGKTKNHSTAAFEKAAAGKNNVLFSKTEHWMQWFFVFCVHICIRRQTYLYISLSRRNAELGHELIWQRYILCVS